MEKYLPYIKFTLRIVRTAFLIILDEYDLGFDFEEVGIVFDLMDLFIELLVLWRNRRNESRRKYK